MPTSNPHPGHSRPLRTHINVLGALTFAGYLCLAVMSYAQSAALWTGKDAPQAGRFLGELREALPLLFGAGHSLTPENAVASYFLLLAVPTLTVVTLQVRLAKVRLRIYSGDVDLLFKWSVAFAVTGLLAFPVFTQDLWLSAAWGRMIISGANPYYMPFTKYVAAGFPLDHFSMVMSYGPLWAIVSAAVMAIADAGVLIVGLTFKLVLGGAWVGTLVVIRNLARRKEPYYAGLAMLMVGWTPLSVTQSLFEGHNDIAMTWLALVWAWLLIKGQGPERLALVASIAVKYVTAPLFLIDLIHELCVRRRSLAQYAKSLIVPALAGLAMFGLFFRSPAFFDGVFQISGWHFLQPDDAVQGFEEFAGVNLSYVALLARGVMPAFAIYCVIKLIRQPGNGQTLRTCVAVQAATTFGLINHLWPWYLIWALAFAAIVPGWWLSRFIWGVALLAPFTLAFWWIEVLEAHKPAAALALYAGAAVWTIATRNVWSRNEDAQPAVARVDTAADDTG